MLKEQVALATSDFLEFKTKNSSLCKVQLASLAHNINYDGQIL